MDLAHIGMIAVLGLVAGAMIGCIGVGGVILVPALHYLGGVPIHVAISAAMLAYVVSGAVGTLVFGHKGSIRWDMTPWLWGGAVPGALAGSLAVAITPGTLLELLIGSLTGGSGLYSIWQNRSKREADAASSGELSSPGLAAVGAVTGFLSSLTGTGGPLVLIPILTWLQMPVLTAIGLSQAIQLPIAAFASAGNAIAGTIDYALGAVLGAGLALGACGGAYMAHSLPRTVLGRIVAVALIVVGALIIARIMSRALG